MKMRLLFILEIFIDFKREVVAILKFEKNAAAVQFIFGKKFLAPSNNFADCQYSSINSVQALKFVFKIFRKLAKRFNGQIDLVSLVIEM